jgi:hypothetical protein
LPVVVKVPKESVDVEMLDAGNAAPPPTEEFMGKNDNFPNSSEYLDDNIWFDMVGETFEGRFDVVTNEMKKKANDLYCRLLSESWFSYSKEGQQEQKTSLHIEILSSESFPVCCYCISCRSCSG